MLLCLLRALSNCGAVLAQAFRIALALDDLVVNHTISACWDTGIVLEDMERTFLSQDTPKYS